jgi:hypothetical protein
VGGFSVARATRATPRSDSFDNKTCRYTGSFLRIYVTSMCCPPLYKRGVHRNRVLDSTIGLPNEVDRSVYSMLQHLGSIEWKLADGMN